MMRYCTLVYSLEEDGGVLSRNLALDLCPMFPYPGLVAEQR
jgi:hypothetical protein